MNNVLDFALNVISQNPQIANNPNAQQLITILRNNDAQQGQIIAQNLCKGGSFPDIGRPSVITLRLIQNRNERK